MTQRLDLRGVCVPDYDSAGPGFNPCPGSWRVAHPDVYPSFWVGLQMDSRETWKGKLCWSRSAFRPLSRGNGYLPITYKETDGSEMRTTATCNNSVCIQHSINFP